MALSEAQLGVDGDVVAEDDELAAAAGVQRPAARRKRRKRIKHATIVTHRWVSLITGLLLVVICTTGAIVVYTPEWTVWTNHGAFAGTAETSHSISPLQAISTVEQAHPGYDGASANLYHGVWEVFSRDDEAHPGFYGVDAATGRITGHADPDRGFMAFMNQIHECFLTCEDYPGYVGWLNTSVPTLGMGWLADITWGGFILGVMGLGLLFLAVSGIWLWWPTFRKWKHGFRVRWSKGRYARDYDLHQVIGMAALPFLLVWGLTGASFEFDWVNQAWYKLTGGQSTDDDSFLESQKPATGTATDIGLAAAIGSAQRVAGPSARLVYLNSPATDEDTATYSFYFSRGFDQYRHGAYPGEYGVNVDRYNAARTQVHDYGSAPTLSNQLMDNWGAALFHYGQTFNGWWRLFWFGFGLSPLILMITGISTWLFKRSVRKRRERLAAERAARRTAAAVPDPA